MEERPNKKVIISQDVQDDREDHAQRGQGKNTLPSDGECQDTPVPNSRIKVMDLGSAQYTKHFWNQIYYALKKAIFKRFHKIAYVKVEE